VIIAHVIDGEVLARKFGLPQGFIDVIREHHGTTLVYYFYCKQVEQMGGDVDAVDENQFRYPGPKPHSKESAIIMMADTVEAASRSLEEVSEASITELVERLIGEKLEDGQFDSCELTFKEFETIKRTIIKNLAVARHLRIKYPEKQA
jgi:membrane-associated HD superfamily phosphohydrolase